MTPRSFTFWAGACLAFFAPASLAQDQKAPVATTTQELALQQREEGVRERLGRLKARIAALPAEGAGAPLPAGATAAEWAEHRRLLHSAQVFYESHLDSLRKYGRLLQSIKALKAEMETGAALREPPPYPASFVDALWNRLRAKERQIAAAQGEQGLIETILEKERARLQIAAQSLRQAVEQLERGSDPVQAPRNRWLRDLAELRNLEAEAQVAMFETERQFNAEMLAYRHAERELLQRRASEASRAQQFSKEELDARLVTLAAEAAELDKRTGQAVADERIAQQRLAY